MRKALVYSVSLLAVLCATALAATPVTEEITVNTGLTGRQVQPSVAMDADGDFAVAWEDRATAANNEIRLRRFTPGGAPTTSEITMDTTGNSEDPAAAMSATGDGVVAWRNATTGAIVARRFDANSAEGAEIPVDPSTAAGAPDVAMDADGDFVVAWEDTTAAPATVRARRFNAAGTPQGASNFLVNEATASPSLDPAVAIDSAGDFVITWERAVGGANLDDVFARAFAADGTPAPGDIPIATGAGDQDDPEAAMNASGELAVAWESGDDVSAIRYDSAGTATSSVFPVHSAPAGAQGNVRLGLSGSGASLAVAWDSNASGSDEVLTRRFDASGTALSGEVPVNTTVAGDQNDPTLAADSSGRFVVAWESPGGNEDIVARRFDPGTTQPPPGGGGLGGGGGGTAPGPDCANTTVILVTCANPSGRLPGVCGPSFASILPACYMPTVPPTVCGPSFGTILQPCQLKKPQILACGGFGTILPQCNPAPKSVPKVCGPSTGTILPPCTGANNLVLACGPSSGTPLPACNFGTQIKAQAPLEAGKTATVDLSLKCPPKKAQASGSAGARAAQNKPDTCTITTSLEATRTALQEALSAHAFDVGMTFLEAAYALNLVINITPGREAEQRLVLRQAEANRVAFLTRVGNALAYVGANGGPVYDVARAKNFLTSRVGPPPYVGPPSIGGEGHEGPIDLFARSVERAIKNYQNIEKTLKGSGSSLPGARSAALKRPRVVKRFKIRAGKSRRVRLKLSRKVVRALLRDGRSSKSGKVVPVRLVLSYSGKLGSRRIPVARLLDSRFRVKATPKSKSKPKAKAKAKAKARKKR